MQNKNIATKYTINYECFKSLATKINKKNCKRVIQEVSQWF